MDVQTSSSQFARVADILGGQRAEALGQAAAGQDPEAAAEHFEELLAGMLVKEMRRALPEGFFGKSAGADVYAGWLDEHLGKALAENGGLDISRSILPALRNAHEEPS